jgi:hypothetical protein
MPINCQKRRNQIVRILSKGKAKDEDEMRKILKPNSVYLITKYLETTEDWLETEEPNI